MNFLFSLFFSLTLTLALAHADCGNQIDLNDKDPLRDMAIQDQDGSGLCYGFAAAQLVEFDLREHGDKFVVSAVDLSMKAGEGIIFDRAKLSGGLVADVMEAAQSKGVVDRRCMEHSVRKLAKNRTMTAAQLVHLLELIYDKYEWNISEDREFYNLKAALEAESISGDIGNQMNHLKGCEYRSALKGLQELGLLGSKVTEIIKKLVANCIVKEVRPYKYKEKIRRGDDDKVLMTELDSILAKKRPASLYLCAAALVANNTKKYDINRDPSCGHHALLVTGKRSNGGKCEYMVRNSWGAQWNPEGVSCACRLPNGKYYQDCDTLKQEVEGAYRVSGTSSASEALVNQYKGRTVLGCWFAADNLIQNSYGVGGIR